MSPNVFSVYRASYCQLPLSVREREREREKERAFSEPLAFFHYVVFRRH